MLIKLEKNLIFTVPQPEETWSWVCMDWEGMTSWARAADSPVIWAYQTSFTLNLSGAQRILDLFNAFINDNFLCLYICMHFPCHLLFSFTKFYIPRSQEHICFASFGLSSVYFRDWHTICTQKCLFACLFVCLFFKTTNWQKEFINFLVSPSFQCLLTLPVKGKEQSGESIVYTCYLLWL